MSRPRLAWLAAVLGFVAGVIVRSALQLRLNRRRRRPTWAMTELRKEPEL